MRKLTVTEKVLGEELRAVVEQNLSDREAIDAAIDLMLSQGKSHSWIGNWLKRIVNRGGAFELPDGTKLASLQFSLAFYRAYARLEKRYGPNRAVHMVINLSKRFSRR